jgi:hypothetical protein
MIPKLLSLSILLVVLCTEAPFASSRPALAQAETPTSESLCRSCHENLYFLHDSGQWCCFCERERSCTCCHGGNPDSADVGLAHEDLVANPIAENPGICKNCHPEDSSERIIRFSHAAGIDPTPSITPTGTAHPSIGAGSTGGGPPSQLLEPNEPDPWQVAAFGFLGAAFIALFLFGFRCWKADCLSQIHAP